MAHEFLPGRRRQQHADRQVTRRASRGFAASVNTVKASSPGARLPGPWGRPGFGLNPPPNSAAVACTPGRSCAMLKPHLCPMNEGWQPSLPHWVYGVRSPAIGLVVAFPRLLRPVQTEPAGEGICPVEANPSVGHQHHRSPGLEHGHHLHAGEGDRPERAVGPAGRALARRDPVLLPVRAFERGRTSMLST